MRLSSKILIAIVCLCVPALLSADQPPKGKGADGKGGGKGPAMSAKEMADDLVEHMMAFDKNKDGKLTRDEITDSRLLRLFDQADTKKAGVETKERLTFLPPHRTTERA